MGEWVNRKWWRKIKAAPVLRGLTCHFRCVGEQLLIALHHLVVLTQLAVDHDDLLKGFESAENASRTQDQHHKNADSQQQTTSGKAVECRS